MLERGPGRGSQGSGLGSQVSGVRYRVSGIGDFVQTVSVALCSESGLLAV